MLACIFPGQGSQKSGMGYELFSKYTDLVNSADEILGYSVVDLCLNNIDNRLQQTLYTQPALYIVNTLTYLQWLEDNKREPDYVLGHSLGEYNALFAAGAYDFLTGLKIVKKRAELMQSISGGSMAAILGLATTQVVEVLLESQYELTVANYNSYTQTVISGKHDDILKIKPVFEMAGASFYQLNVSGAFHSPYLKSSKQEFAGFLSQFRYQPLKIPVISNVSAEPYSNQQLVEYLTWQMVSPVRWVKSIEYLSQQGVEEFIETGPGRVLTNLLKHIQQGK